MDPTQVTPRAYTQGRVRFSDPWKFLPVAFICFTIGALYLIYVFSHCASLLQFDVSAKRVDDAMRQRGIMHLFVFHVITALVLTCYVRSILVHPGEVPDTDKWIYAEGRMPTPIETATLNLQETKKTGARRYCKWCEKYKPDRCHHCRVCRQCILKMDHHCPWIYNCVGFHNYKYFFLLLVYSGIGCIWIPTTMLESVVRSVNDDDPIWTMFCLFFGQTLAIFLQVLIWSFLSFHIYLGLKAMTTIEYCEKNMPKDPHAKQGGLSFETSVYDLGTLGNIKAVLGPNPWLWFLPCSPPQGDGMNFVGEEIRLTKDLEAGKGMRRKGHQQAQRQSRNARAMWGDDGEDWSGPAR